MGRDTVSLMGRYLMRYRMPECFLIPLFFCFLILAITVTSEATEDLEIPGAAPSQSVGPISLEVGIWVIDIDNIDSVNQSFAANVFIILRWKNQEPLLLSPAALL